MNAEQKIANLQKEIEGLKSQQQTCRHSWNPAIYDPEEFMEPYGSKFIGRGSDWWTEPEGYQKAYRQRWSRSCKLCGKKEFTSKQEQIKVEFAPKF